ncbi:uncharacterized protein BKA78DRAFT_45632 [Phyllosticta capitalensis]|uniref:uncharacterized protein n=1 Tax=Phyllosticta capitalensis TaxID=121624 RepID=UPI0031325DAF
MALLAVLLMRISGAGQTDPKRRWVGQDVFFRLVLSSRRTKLEKRANVMRGNKLRRFPQEALPVSRDWGLTSVGNSGYPLHGTDMF